MFRTLAFAGLCTLLAAPSLRAADLVVHPGQSIQAAIDAASPGDRVLLTPGSWSEQLDFHGKAIAVVGQKGAAVTILDGGAGAPIVRFASGEGPGSRLAGVTVTGGGAAQGAGGVVCTGATPTLEDCVIRGNHGKWGGGISGSPVMRRCLVLDNSASLTHGGGIYGAPTMTQCVVAGNTATSADGGGVYAPSGHLAASDCVFVGNHAVFADSSGGGVVVKSTASASFTRCLFAQNTASGGAFPGVAGGLWAQSSATTLVDCIVLGNTLTGSSLHGGGIYGPATLVNTIVRGNSAPQLEGLGPVSWSNVQGGFAGVGNFDLDPLFVDAAGLDLHLLAGSPCIDAGDPTLFDADGSRSDVGAWAFATLYSRVNTTAAHFAAPSFDGVSAQGGGRQDLWLQAGVEHGDELYLLAGSLSGTEPGFDLGPHHVPLQMDAWFSYTLTNAGSILLPGSVGVLDRQGRAQMAFVLPANLPGAAALVGFSMNHAALVGTASPAHLTFVSNAVALDLVP